MINETVEVVVKIPKNTFERLKNMPLTANVRDVILEAVENGIVLPEGYKKLVDVDVVKQKVFDITDLYDSGKYLVFEDGKYLIGDDIQNDNRRVLSFNEALQGVINGIPTIIESKSVNEVNE